MKRFGMVIAIFIMFAFFFSCSKSYFPVKFKTNKTSLLFNDSIKLSWKIRGKQKYGYALLNGNITIKEHKGDTILYPITDTMYSFKVYDKHGKVVSKRHKKIKVKQPKILLFSAFRDRFNPQTVILSWQTKNIQSVSLEGYAAKLPPNGSYSIQETGHNVFNLIAETPFTKISQSCFIDELDTKEVFIERDTAIGDLHDDRILKMRIVENDISNFPQEVKLKVLVYDTLGNFINNLAPPYGSEETAKQFFRKIVEKSNKNLQNVKFTVKEVHDSPDKFDIALTLDYSGSMFLNIDSIEKATEFFIKNKYPNDCYSVVKYDNQLVECCPLTNNVETILKNAQFNGVAGLRKFGGSTALYAGSDKGLQSLKSAKHQKIVLLFTDGFENSSLEHFGQYASSLKELVHNIRLQNARMIIVGLGFINNPLLRELSYYTNGSFYYIQYPQNIYKVYKELLHNFRTYYEITIKPINDPGEHIIQLTYFNRKDSATVERPYYIGNISLPPTKFYEDKTAYWYKNIKNTKYKLAAPPQTLVNFQSDKNEIESKYYKPLLSIINYIKKTPNALVLVYGHTDTRGSNEYNQKLSERRAKAVRDFMIRYGVNQKIIKWRGYGESKPIWANDSADWAAKENRRVEIIILRK